MKSVIDRGSAVPRTGSNGFDIISVHGSPKIIIDRSIKVHGVRLMQSRIRFHVRNYVLRGYSGSSKAKLWSL